MRFWLLLALALAGCAKTGVPEAPPIPKPRNPDAVLYDLPPIPERPTRLVRLPNGTLVEEVRP